MALDAQRRSLSQSFFWAFSLPRLAPQVGSGITPRAVAGLSDMSTTTFVLKRSKSLRRVQLEGEKRPLDAEANASVVIRGCEFENEKQLTRIRTCDRSASVSRGGNSRRSAILYSDTIIVGIRTIRP